MKFDTPESLLQRLIQIPSVNPAQAGKPEHKGELRMAEFLVEFLGALGAETETLGEDPDRPNVIATFGSLGPGGRTLMIEGHTDTVSVEGMTVPPFEGLIRDGCCYGRGASDMKGPMATALWALTPARIQAIRTSGNVLKFVGAVDEECGTRGAAWLAGQGLTADEAIILEPTLCELVLAHKGPAWLEVEVTGKAGHGAEPERGVNAIQGMAKALVLMEHWHASRAAALQHPLLGRPTFNPGVIRGGSGTNIIPDRCVLQLDMRLLPGESAERMREELQQLLMTLVHQGTLTGARVELTSHAPAVEFPTQSRLAQRLRQVIEGMGTAPVNTGSPWFSDAAPLSVNIPECVVWGPGSIRQAHTKDEFINLEEFRRGVSIMEAFLDAFADKGTTSHE